MSNNNCNQPPTGHFWKLFLPVFVDMMVSVSESKRFCVIGHILKNLNYKNQYIGTMQEVADETSVSYKTVRLTFKAMREKNILREKQPGVNMINPMLLMMGPAITKLRLVTEYNSLGDSEIET
jgi:predicted transcriptional regulator